jgi:peptidoglycan/xylan/chitin deacetylase (PgdA/CDA1 family)
MSSVRLLPALLLATAAAVAPAHADPICGGAYDPAERLVHRGRPPVTPPLVHPLTPATTAPGVVRRVAPADGAKLVALTFDLCETAGEVAGYDGGVVAALRAADAPATFFTGGHWAATHPVRFAELLGDGRFEIASHGWTHANLRITPAERLALEIAGPTAEFERAAVARACPAPPVRAPSRYFRFPFGACDPTSLKAVAGAGLVPVQWDVSSGDPSPGQSAAAIRGQVLAQVRPGSIVLMHANGRGWHTAEALPGLITALRARGYTLVTVGTLMASGTPETTATCYDARPGDTDRYDHWRAAAPATTAALTRRRAGR